MLGELIKTARFNKNMTTSNVSAVIGVSQGYISKIELNQKQPSLPVLEKLSETLEIPYDELLIASGYLDKSKYLGLIQENNQLRKALEKVMEVEAPIMEGTEEWETRSYKIAREALGGEAK
ncbi:helix-turn-helix domain-containing protein [Lysinibacillus sphaericus]|uniref:helix-turn-helix domain-containing protein n=1 Tax=Lysinibacillus sphaericus TaxID=1421 RepID=UPI00191064D4|nr:helix-turn-helix transcriptional regulator [Lysinibacillus sphaericus]QPA56282.1 helix-turn-helix transcriptional regulator [Lysinibacillus sphaericus]